MKKMKIVFEVIVFFVLISSAFSADTKVKNKNKDTQYATPLQLSLYAPVQLAPMDSDVYGLRLACPYGVNRNVIGLDCGFWNTSTGKQYGLQLGGLAAFRGGKTYGLNIGGIINFSEGNEYGVSLAGIYNQASGSITGVQFAGILSKARRVVGLQFALITYCDDLRGVQIGLLNICPRSAIPCMLLINAKY